MIPAAEKFCAVIADIEAKSSPPLLRGDNRTFPDLSAIVRRDSEQGRRCGSLILIFNTDVGRAEMART